MSVTEDAAPKDTATDNKGDEQIGNSPELLTDPAILAVNPKFRYDKEQLLKLRDAPLSQRKPDFLDINEVSPNIWDPNRSKKPSECTEPRAVEEHRRRPGDPRERLRKENDGIVLSPQRRSFNSGCSVPARVTVSVGAGAGASSNRPHSPLKGDPGSHLQTGSRRIGSGRILRDNWEPENGDDYSGFRGADRRFRDYDSNKDKRGRYGERRRVSGGDEEPPEWFSSGPSSQNDTIELRGFDESERLRKKKMTPSQVKRARDWFKKKTEATLEEEKDEVTVEGGPDGRSTPNHDDKKEETKELANEKKAQDKEEQEEQAYTFEDILKSDSIPGLPGLLTNGVGADGDTNGKSRFSKWFTMENSGDSRRSSIQDEAMIKNLLKDISEPTVSIPGDANSYFAPISPAANTSTKSVNIMEMLRGGGTKDKQQQQVTGRIMNLNEIEAKLRQTNECSNVKPKDEDMTAFNRLLANMSVGNNAQNKQPMSLMEMLSHSQQMDEAHARMSQLLGPQSPDLARLQQQQKHEMLSKLMNVGVPRASPLPEMGLQQSRELLNRPEAQAILQGLKLGDITPQHLYQQLANPALQPRHRDLLVTILKLQSGGGGAGVGPSPRVLSPVAAAAAVPPPPTHQMFQQQQQQQQQQQLRISPLPPPNALHQRIPSPRELQVHTQNILQRALIKKKLEEQQENFRKKQEMQQRGQSPNNNNNNHQPKSVSSPTPLAFTPTSVLRKMTAEKEEGGKDVTKMVEGGKLAQGRAVTGMRQQQQQQQQPAAAAAAAAVPPQQQQQQWQYPMKQAGRPIVKANNFQPQEFFMQQQQQKYIQQQQQQQRKFHHGSMTPHPSQFGNPNQQFSQLQQLRAQHQQQQQRPPPPPPPTGNNGWQQFLNTPAQNRGQGRSDGGGGGSGGDLSPTTNQLTRWFSPDLLERARVGELPSTAGLSQHLLSLEEIERLTAPPVHN